MMKAAIAILIILGLAMLSCAPAEEVVVVVEKSSVTVWSPGGAAVTVPMENIVIHGYEHIPLPTPVRPGVPSPTPYPTPSPPPTPSPGTIIELSGDDWVNPFKMAQFDGAIVGIEVVMSAVEDTHLRGWLSHQSAFVYCILPERMSTGDRAYLATLEHWQSVEFIGTFKTDVEIDPSLYDCWPHPVSGE